jgi:4-azaleucine resistance transporter AzlC
MVPPHPSDSSSFTLLGALLGARRALPLALAGLTEGVAFGVLARQAGMSLAETLAMSGLVYAGTAQFVALGLWVAPLPVVALAATTLLVNARHLLMGATLAPWLRRLSPLQRYASAYFLTDETWALVLRERAQGAQDNLDGAILLGSGLPIFVAWVLTTAVGYLVGAGLRDPARWGLDFAFPALVVALLAGLWRGRATLAPWAVAALVALLASISLPGDWYILLGGLAGALVGALRHAD